jgi:hypothetical protein
MVIAIPIQAQEGPTHTGDVTTDIEGYPDLNPKPIDVTPDFSFDTVAYLSVRPNPIGVGQSLLVNIWTTPGTHHSFYMCDFKVTIEDPAGEQEVRVMDSYFGDVSKWFEFKPDILGTWRLKFEQPGTYAPAGEYRDRPGTTSLATYTLPYSVWWKPSETGWQEVEVQEDIVFSWPASELPTDYWKRPANPINREWWSILGNYPFDGCVYYYPGGRELYAGSLDRGSYKYTPYVQAPNTPHVVWKRQGDVGGLIGAEAYQYSLRSGGNTPDIIFFGRCYGTVTKAVNGERIDVWQCYDLRTGEVYWEQTGVPAPTYITYSRPSLGNVSGAIASQGYSLSLLYLGGSRMIKYDPWDGAAVVNVSTSPISGGKFYKDPYVLSVQSLGGVEYRLINWTVEGSTSNFADRVISNISWPLSSFRTRNWEFNENIAIYGSFGDFGGAAWTQWRYGYNLYVADLTSGEFLYQLVSNETHPPDTLVYTIQNPASLIADRGKIAMSAVNRHWIAWEARSGEIVWESDLTEYPWGNWWAYNTASYDFNETKGAIIACSFDGIYAIDWDDGSIIWHYQDPNAVPFENPYTTEEGSPATPFFTSIRSADGKIYAFNGEHVASQPVVRDWKLHCINATTGELVWQIHNPMEPGAVADGYLTASNPYDGYMYVFGKGGSKTTVTAPNTSVPLGTSVVIRGTVLDQSPGQPRTPCVSADSMSTQMEYLHLQFPIDGIWHNETITGVPVYLTAIDQDNNVYDLGMTTINGYYGTFGFEWTPPEEGTYEIIACFNGDDSYGSSAASTFISVGPEPEPYPEAPDVSDLATQEDVDQKVDSLTPMFLGIIIAVIVTILLVIYTLWAVRKQQKLKNPNFPSIFLWVYTRFSTYIVSLLFTVWYLPSFPY